MKPDFHTAADRYSVATAELQWVIERRPARDVHYAFATHYHPYSEALIERLNLDGLPALLDPAWQAKLEVPLANATYQPGTDVDPPFPKHEIDVSDDGPYSIYNWELFFHAPLLIATHLSKNQRFEEARRWFHFLFDPTSTDPDPAPQRFWKFLRFRQQKRQIIHDEWRRQHEIAHPHDAVEAARQPVTQGPQGRHVRGHEDKSPAWPKHARHLGNKAAFVARQDVPKRAKTDGDIEIRLERHPQRIGPRVLQRRHSRRVGRAPPCFRQHAGADVHADHAVAAQGLQHTHRRPSAATNIQAAGKGTQRLQMRAYAIKEEIRGSKRRVIKLRREQIIAALGRRQSLSGEFPE